MKLPLNINSVIDDKNKFFIFLFACIFIFSVFIDLLNGFISVYLGINISIGSLYRTSLFLILTPFFILTKEQKVKPFIIFVSLFWIINQLVLMYYFSVTNNKYSFTSELEQFIRYLMVFFIYFFVYEIYIEKKFDIKSLVKYSVLWLNISVSALIFSFVTGIGLVSYGQAQSFGTTSFFIAINDISLAMLMIYPFSIYFFLINRTKSNFVSLIIVSFGMFLVTSRTLLVGSIGVIIIYLFSILFLKSITPKIKLTIFFIGFFLSSLMISLLTYIILSDTFLSYKFFLLFEEKPRHYVQEIAKKRINSREKILNNFGEGIESFSATINNNFANYSKERAPKGQIVEVDPLDSIGFYGYYLGTIIVIFPFIVIGILISVFLINPNLLNFTFVISMSLYITHSMMAGHALTNLYCAPILATIYFYAFSYKKIIISKSYNP